MRVAAVDDYVAVVEKRKQFFYHVVNRLSRFYHHHDAARLFKRRDELLERIRADDVLAFGASLDEILYLFGRAVEYRNLKAVAFHIHNEVFPHYRKTDKSYV